MLKTPYRSADSKMVVTRRRSNDGWVVGMDAGTGTGDTCRACSNSFSTTVSFPPTPAPSGVTKVID